MSFDGMTVFKYRNNLSDEEARQFHLTIKDCLCEMPYACAMILQRFSERTRMTYVRETGYEADKDVLANESIGERIISLQMCNNVVTDDVIAEYIRFAGGDQLLFALTQESQWPFQEDNHDLVTKYAIEMKEFTSRFKNHPLMKNYVDMPEANAFDYEQSDEWKIRGDASMKGVYQSKMSFVERSDQ
mmetsp:Transcript_1954/g.3395  ORF Transcript_1954/g.3395 Transcript_1954/m.3395 type:complete len:187 (+) Transcript_1954:2131-2691(+)